MRRLATVVTILALAGCQKGDKQQPPGATGSGGVAANHAGSGAAARLPRPRVPQVKPAFDLKNPPADAQKMPSGLVVKKIVSNDAGTQPKRNDTVLINYTGWKQGTGETFFSNMGRGRPMPLDLANTAPGFTEGLQMLRKGEKAMLWVPPKLAYKHKPQGEVDTLVFEIEIVDVVAAPPVPADVKAPPANARATKSGIKYVVVRPGTGKDKAKLYDTVTFNYTAWDGDGRQVDSTEVRKRPASVAPYRQKSAMKEILTEMTAGERVRFWLDAAKALEGPPRPGMPTGMLCYEVEILQIAKGHAPPPVPRDVAKPPASAKKTAKGVFYRVLRTGKGGAKPGPKDKVKVEYTGWQTDGEMFDSSVVKGQPAEFRLDSVIAGWTDGVQQMSIGDKFRFWIPAELAYKGAPGRPQGMLVFDIELLEIKAAPARPSQAKQPAPPDVAAPPKDAKKTAKGVFYKVLHAGKGGAKPGPTDRVKVHYTGWKTDGEQFDSSLSRGKPAEFGLNRVIPGWTDGLQLMSPGDKYRFWIPEELAYKGKPGRPQGMLVFDVELLEIVGK